MPHSLHNQSGSSAACGLSVCRPVVTCVLLCPVSVARMLLFYFSLLYLIDRLSR